MSMGAIEKAEELARQRGLCFTAKVERVDVPASIIMPLPETCAVVLYCPSCPKVFTRHGHELGGMVCECGEHDQLQVLEVRRYQDVENPVLMRPPAKASLKAIARKNRRWTQKSVSEWKVLVADLFKNCPVGMTMTHGEISHRLGMSSGTSAKVMNKLLEDGKVELKRVGNSKCYQLASGGTT